MVLWFVFADTKKLEEYGHQLIWVHFIVRCDERKVQIIMNKLGFSLSQFVVDTACAVNYKHVSGSKLLMLCVIGLIICTGKAMKWLILINLCVLLSFSVGTATRLRDGQPKERGWISSSG